MLDPVDEVAGPDKPGTAAGHDFALALRAVRDAAASSDLVVVMIHWGVELDARPRAVPDRTGPPDDRRRRRRDLRIAPAPAPTDGDLPRPPDLLQPGQPRLASPDAGDLSTTAVAEVVVDTRRHDPGTLAPGRDRLGRSSGAHSTPDEEQPGRVLDRLGGCSHPTPPPTCSPDARVLRRRARRPRGRASSSRRRTAWPIARHEIPNTVDTQFAIASGTKGLTALTVVSLIEDGALDLDHDRALGARRRPPADRRRRDGRAPARRIDPASATTSTRTPVATSPTT